MTSERMALVEHDCAWCGAPAAERLCPRNREICAWCCPRCAADKCARGVYRTLWPAAERIARELMILGDSLAEAVTRFELAFCERVRLAPEPMLVAEARFVLAQRIDGAAPPVPPSSSSTSLRLPQLLIGLPKRSR